MSRNTAFNMGASDDEPFSIVAPNRAVRIGGRLWPASTTEEEGGEGHRFSVAHIPHENGALVTVSHAEDSSPHHHFHMTWYANNGQPDDGYTKGIAVHTRFARDPDTVNQNLDEIGSEEVHPDTVRHNRDLMNSYRQATS